MRTSLKALTATASAALLVAGLAACSSGETSSTSTPAAGTCQNVGSGATSKSVTVSGDFGAAPKVTFDSPLKAKDVERTVVITGKGAVVKSGSNVDIALAAYNGTTGKELSPAQGFDGSATAMVKVDDKTFIPGLVRAVECLHLGSRVVLTAPAASAFGNQNLSQVNLTDKDSVVFVADLVDLAQTRATGKAVTPPADFPKVTLDAKTGEPSITVPKTDPPTETKIAELKQGDGATVASTDTVTIQYKGVLWRNGQMFDSTWSRGTPYTNVASGFVAGFTKALVGQKVGSQVIVVIPPADGYGSAGNGEIKGTDTMVFVVDILKSTK
ncbi:peptidylprolyl isomerase [Leifsonia sp. ku-ls]|nr:peptidylprolyl isomerase [Leifsonia sp. ku-ls]